MNDQPLTTPSQFLAGLAWASCWPAAFQAGSGHYPGLILLGAGFAILPDTLDSWCARPWHRPDIHIVPPPENPDPQMIASALASAISLSHESGKSLDLACYPIPIGRDRWRPYTLHLDGHHRRISVMLQGPDPICGTTATSVVVTSDQSHLLTIHVHPLVLRILPVGRNRASLLVMPAEQQWTHSLITACALGAIPTILWGYPAGTIACGAYILHILSHQWNFTGSALFWPLQRKRYPGLQRLHSFRGHTGDFAILWMSFLLITGNMLRSASPPIPEPSLFQLLVFGGVLPLGLWSLFHFRD